MKNKRQPQPRPDKYNGTPSMHCLKTMANLLSEQMTAQEVYDYLVDKYDRAPYRLAQWMKALLRMYLFPERYPH